VRPHTVGGADVCMVGVAQACAGVERCTCAAVLNVLDEGVARVRAGVERHTRVPVLNVLDEGVHVTCTVERCVYAAASRYAVHAVGCAS
jgi:hypothetical protein